MNDIKTIVTHDGKFHADEVMAVTILKRVLGGAYVIRSRNAQEITSADFAVDVGGGKHDHHQRGGNGVRHNGVPYSSAGLIWRDFGHEALNGVDGFVDVTDTAMTPAEVDALWVSIDEKLIQEIDAIDNGAKDPSPTCFSAVIRSMNVPWDCAEEGEHDAAFDRAIQVAQAVLEGIISQEYGRLRAKKLVQGAVTACEGQEVLMLDTFMPWQNVLAELDHGFKFVVFGNGTDWKVQTIQKFYEDGSRETIKLLPEHWGGLQQDSLVQATGVVDVTFCHKGLFIAGAQSREGAIALAKAAL